jgi:hypothetical protein
MKIKIGQFLEIADILLEVHAYKKKSFISYLHHLCKVSLTFDDRNRNRNKFINQITAPGGHIIQLTIMIDTQQTCPTLS